MWCVYNIRILGIPICKQYLKFEQNAWMFPIFFQFQYLGEITPALHMKVTAGLGYEFLYASYNDYENKREDSFFFHGR